MTLPPVGENCSIDCSGLNDCALTEFLKLYGDQVSRADLTGSQIDARTIAEGHLLEASCALFKYAVVISTDLLENPDQI